MEVWPIVVLIFGAGLGWGIHQVSLTVLNRQVARLEGRMETIERDMNLLAQGLGRMESKLDMLLRACPAMQAARQGSCGP
jgi:hypothetical protein